MSPWGTVNFRLYHPHWLTSGAGVVSNLVFLAVRREDYILKLKGSISWSEFSF